MDRCDERASADAIEDGESIWAAAEFAMEMLKNFFPSH
jgi:hypothetical protein